MFTARKKFLVCVVAVAALTAAVAGCARMPYDRTTQTTVGGAVAGAAIGAILADEDNALLGAVLGGLAGAAAGHVIGARTSWFGEGNEQAFNRTATQAMNESVSVEDVYGSSDADLNNDGLVTQEELITLSNAGLTADEMINRLQATNQVFHVTRQQRQSLLAAGVPSRVVYSLEEINRG